MQTDLFGPVDMPMSSPVAPQVLTTTRNWRGYTQHLVGGKWLFVITGFDGAFSGQLGTCSVLMFDGSERDVEIDAQDRIRIGKTMYGPSSWVH